MTIIGAVIYVSLFALAFFLGMKYREMNPKK